MLQPPIEAGILQAPPHPPEPEPQATANDPWAIWEGVPEGQGWRYIVEEEPED